MSEFTYTDRYDIGRTSAHIAVHLSRQTEIDAGVRHPDPYDPHVVLDLAGDDTRVAVFINDPAVLDRLLSTLAEARAAWVAELIALTDISKVG